MNAIENIKAGEQVVLSWSGYTVETVHRVTKTQVVLLGKSEYKFRKKDGRMVGWDDIWRPAPEIQVVSDNALELVAATEERKKRLAIAAEIRRIDLSSVEADVLQRALNILKSDSAK